ncbi:MAG: T9SS type A sorting domain-containing protein [Hymenobacteraceae bacterium]|nr:T9SS type A sorting domain-containing protein [Hymenobacteraceae bacterium]
MFEPLPPLTVAPNPSAGLTTLTYALAKPAVVTLTVVGGTGRTVATLTSGEQAAGPRTVLFTSADLPVGLYTCRLQTPTGSRAVRLVVGR